MPLEVQFLPAREGDAIWIRWGAAELDHQMFIDMGTEATGEAIAERLLGLDVADRSFELLVVSHVDRDHIGGVLTCVSDRDDPIEGLRFGDFWFNGWDHLHDRVPPAPNPHLEPMGGVMGERLSKWLRTTRWNGHFGRGRIVSGDTSLETVEFADDLSLTILGPTAQRLTELIDDWEDEVHAALEKGSLDPDDVSDGLRPPTHPGLESYGPKVRPVLADRIDLEELAATRTGKDPSDANGSSISLLLRWGDDVAVLLCGDAYADDLVDAFELLGGGAPVEFDVFKLPHHGSKKNVTTDLVGAVRCPYWLFSTDGNRFRHPDPTAIARILTARVTPDPTLGFNAPSTYNRWWDDEDWQGDFGYTCDYGTATDGLTLRWDRDRADGPATMTTTGTPNKPT